MLTKPKRVTRRRARRSGAASGPTVRRCCEHGGPPVVRALRPEGRLALLAPRFRDAVVAALAECRELGLEVQVYETYRSAALQAQYWARGRTVKPPLRPVTNARDHLESWHGFGLAVDVIHARLGWGAGRGWYSRVAAVFARHGCVWGGAWQQADLPHFQWGRCRVSPSSRAREMYARGGMAAVWGEVGAG